LINTHKPYLKNTPLFLALFWMKTPNMLKIVKMDFLGINGCFWSKTAKMIKKGLNREKYSKHPQKQMRWSPPL